MTLLLPTHAHRELKKKLANVQKQKQIKSIYNTAHTGGICEGGGG